MCLLKWLRDTPRSRAPGKLSLELYTRYNFCINM
jgi:hypothetical protein